MQADVNEALARQFGLDAEEYARVLTIMGRTPTLTELGVFSMMWSEHSHDKLSRVQRQQAVVQCGLYTSISATML